MRTRIEKYKGTVIWFDGTHYRAFLTCLICDSLEEIKAELDKRKETEKCSD